MAGNSAIYPESDKNNTKTVSRKRKREPFSKEDALGILMAALNECIEAGLMVIVDNQGDDASLVIKGAQVVLAETGHKIVVKQPLEPQKAN